MQYLLDVSREPSGEKLSREFSKLKFRSAVMGGASCFFVLTVSSQWYLEAPEEASLVLL